MKALIDELKNLTNSNTVFYDIQRIAQQIEEHVEKLDKAMIQFEEEYAVIMELHHE